MATVTVTRNTAMRPATPGGTMASAITPAGAMAITVARATGATMERVIKVTAVMVSGMAAIGISDTRPGTVIATPFQVIAMGIGIAYADTTAMGAHGTMSGRATVAASRCTSVTDLKTRKAPVAGAFLVFVVPGFDPDSSDTPRGYWVGDCCPPAPPLAPTLS